MKKTVYLLAALLLLAATATAKKKSNKEPVGCIVDSMWRNSRVITLESWLKNNEPEKRIFEVPEGWTVDTLVDTTYVLRKVETPKAPVIWRSLYPAAGLDTLRSLYGPIEVEEQ